MNIIELAKQAGFDWHTGWTLENDAPNRFEVFAALVAEHEREACAKVCESYLSDSPYSWGSTTMASAIRARGQA